MEDGGGVRGKKAAPAARQEQNTLLHIIVNYQSPSLSGLLDRWILCISEEPVFSIREMYEGLS